MFESNIKLNDVQIGDKIVIVANHADMENGYVDYANGIVEKITIKQIALNIGRLKPIIFKKQRIVSVNKL